MILADLEEIILEFEGLHRNAKRAEAARLRLRVFVITLIMIPVFGYRGYLLFMTLLQVPTHDSGTKKSL